MAKTFLRFAKLKVRGNEDGFVKEVIKLPYKGVWINIRIHRLNRRRNNCVGSFRSIRTGGRPKEDDEVESDSTLGNDLEREKDEMAGEVDQAICGERDRVGVVQNSRKTEELSKKEVLTKEEEDRGEGFEEREESSNEAKSDDRDGKTDKRTGAFNGVSEGWRGVREETEKGGTEQVKLFQGIVVGQGGDLLAMDLGGNEPNPITHGPKGGSDGSKAIEAYSTEEDGDRTRELHGLGQRYNDREKSYLGKTVTIGVIGREEDGMREDSVEADYGLQCRTRKSVISKLGSSYRKAKI